MVTFTQSGSLWEGRYPQQVATHNGRCVPMKALVIFESRGERSR